MASVFKRKGEPNWYAAYFPAKGRRIERSTRTTDKKLALRMAREWENKELERKAGLIDPKAEALAAHGARPISEHLSDFEHYLSAKGTTEEAIDLLASRLGRVLAEAKIDTIADFSPTAILCAVDHLRTPSVLRPEGLSNRTANEYLRGARSFSRWLQRNRRSAVDELASLSLFNADADRRRVRRDLSSEEVALALAAARASQTVRVKRKSRNAAGERRVGYVTLSYPEREWGYRIAAESGLRSGEIASLTPESFDLRSDPPTIRVAAAYTKNRKEALQPIRPEFAADLGSWLAKKPKGTSLDLLPHKKAAQLLEADLATARATWIAQASTPAEREEREKSDFLRYVDGQGRFADFHSLRVSYISRVLDAGANLKEAMELARHSDPRLTMKTYARVGLVSLARVLDNMPGTERTNTPQAQRARATGTDDTPISAPAPAPQYGRELRLTSAHRRDEPEQIDEGGAAPESLDFKHQSDTAHTGASQHTKRLRQDSNLRPPRSKHGALSS
jgi:integrase/recombinase XerC